MKRRKRAAPALASRPHYRLSDRKLVKLLIEKVQALTHYRINTVYPQGSMSESLNLRSSVAMLRSEADYKLQILCLEYDVEIKQRLKERRWLMYLARKHKLV